MRQKKLPEFLGRFQENNSTRKMNTRLITTINGLYAVAWNSVAFFWAIYFTEIGLNGVQIGSIMGARELTGILFITVGGLLNDRIKSKKLISVAFLLLVTIFLSLSTTTEYLTILIFFILFGLAMTLWSISKDSILLKTSGGKKQSNKIGYFLAAGWLGGAIGFIIGGQILEVIEFTSLFKIIAVALGGIFFLSLFLPETEIKNPKLVEYKGDIMRKEVMLFLLIIFLFSTHFGAEATSYGLFLKENLSLSMKGMGLYMGGAVGVMALSVLFLSKFSEKKWLLHFGLLASGVGFIGMCLTGNIYASFIWRVIHEIGDTAMFVFLYYSLTKFFPAERLGGNTSIVTLAIYIAAASASLIFGIIGDKMGYDTAIIISGIICILAFFLSLYERKLVKHG
jgi:MFS family permease